MKENLTEWLTFKTFRMSADGTPAEHKRRTPFIPYAIKNDTGSPLKFATVTTNPNRFVTSLTVQHV